MNAPRPDRAFDHVLLTRFNVRFDGFPPPADDWLFYRWAFFCDALAASVAHQTSRDFRWIVFFDEESPSWLKDEIRAKSENLFIPCFVSYWSRTAVQLAVMDVATEPHLITTRIDSDDAIATRFVEDIHSRFDRQKSLYLNLLCGVQVDRTGAMYRYDEPSNPFLSYIEKRVDGERPRTVFYSMAHGASRHYADLLSVVGPPRWMQIIHGTNLANGIRGLRVRPERYEADFQLDLPIGRRVGTGRYLRERASSVVGLARFWLLRPYYAREFVTARRLRLAGTQLLPRLDEPTEEGSRPGWLRRAARPVLRVLRRRGRTPTG